MIYLLLNSSKLPIPKPLALSPANQLPYIIKYTLSLSILFIIFFDFLKDFCLKMY